MKETAYPKSRFRLEKQALRYLQHIIDGKNKSPGQFPKVTEVPENILSRGIHFLSWCEKQNSFKRRCEKAIDMLSMSLHEVEDFRTNFAGRLFADIASIYLTAHQAEINPDRTVASGENALLFFEKLYPNSFGIRYSSAFNIGSLGYASMPDGFIVGPSGIVSVCEYTLMENKAYFKNRHYRFKTRKRKSPDIFSNSDLLFVVPQTVPYVMKEIGESVGDEVKFLELPFSRSDFRKFFNKSCHTYGIDKSIFTLKGDGVIYPAPQRLARQSVGLVKISEAKCLMPPTQGRGCGVYERKAV